MAEENIDSKDPMVKGQATEEKQAEKARTDATKQKNQKKAEQTEKDRQAKSEEDRKREEAKEKEREAYEEENASSNQGQDVFAGMRPEEMIPASEDEDARIKEETKDVLKDRPNSEKAREYKNGRKAQYEKGRNFMAGIKMAAHLGKNPQRLAEEIAAGVREGKISSIDANPYYRKLAENPAAVRLRQADALRINRELEQAGRKTLDDYVEEIKSLDEGYEKTKALKDLIELTNPDNGLSDELLRLIAGDEEASEKFVSKVVYKPLEKNPEGDYSLSFYASINFESFLTMVGDIKGKDEGKTSGKRRQNYAEQNEMALRLHEAHKATVTQSANIEGLMNVARTLSNTRLQVGIELDGVGQARNILELSFGRLFGNYDRLKSEQYQTEIVNWANNVFTEQVQSGEVKSSRFMEKDGKTHRNLEDWEIKRAFALARNYHAALLRVPELTSWGTIPKPAEEWLKSMPGETLVRIIGGPKYLQGRFRSGQTTGGNVYLERLRRNIAEKYKGKLNKIGTLDIRKELLPLGLFSAGGFEKGWRPMGSYLNIPFMKIDISRLRRALPQLTENAKKGKKITPEALLRQFLTEQRHLGEEPDQLKEPEKFKEYLARRENLEKSAEINLGEFLLHNAGFANEYYGQEILIDGVAMPKELTVADAEKSKNAMEELMLPLMGLTVKSDKAGEALNKLREKIERNEEKGITDQETRKDLLKGHFDDERGEFIYDFFDYDPAEDQVNFSLGVLISAGGISKNVKTMLWQKTAETMPLRIAYLLSEEGVKPREVKDENGKISIVPGLSGYESVKGEALSDGGYRLFNKSFEGKLIKLHMIRMREQEKAQDEFIRTSKRQPPIKLSDYFTQAGLTDSKEIEFVRQLQKLGKEKAADLAEVDFPHVPFLDDVPFQKAKYVNLGQEVYARRMNDERGYSDTRDAAGAVVDHLEKPFAEIEENWGKVKDALSGPEGSKTAQDAVLKLAKPYFSLAKQYDRARIIGYRDIASIFNKPCSELQKWFSSNAYAWNTRMMNVNIRDLAGKALIRNEKLPGETESQVQQLLGDLKAKPFRVFISEIMNAIGQWLLYSLLAFPANIKEKK